MSNSHDSLMLALLDVLRFLELSGPGLVEQDAAVEMMEQVASRLQTLDLQERRRLLELVAEEAASETSPAGKRFLARFAQNFGLA